MHAATGAPRAVLPAAGMRHHSWRGCKITHFILIRQRFGWKNRGRAAAGALPGKARQACVSTPYGPTGLVGLCQRGVAGYVATLVDAAGKHHAGQP